MPFNNPAAMDASTATDDLVGRPDGVATGHAPRWGYFTSTPYGATTIANPLAQPALEDEELAVLRLLEKSGPLDAGGVAGRLGVSLSAARRTLQSLSVRGLVTSKETGQKMVFSVNSPAVRRHVT